ncbi:LOW QUALITY PROTEIN: hypothetical protein Cgig2_030496 [Carnegiea gigantea]|uniref:Uncharacterized protein n=1 Tax=Carnegiea gigantea TaxID=171969 RepID=A0A9Q1GTT5_9CARY|nr:LOW QUALITY PROTEIN: hypothetical protein Cgig2_030496 [Carnegiea gigantea]
MVFDAGKAHASPPRTMIRYRCLFRPLAFYLKVADLPSHKDIRVLEGVTADAAVASPRPWHVGAYTNPHEEDSIFCRVVPMMAPVKRKIGYKERWLMDQCPNLLCLSLHVHTPFFLMEPLILGDNLLRGGLPGGSRQPERGYCEIFQLRKPIQELFIAGFASFLLEPFLGIHYPGHERGDRPRAVVLPNIEPRQLPKRIPNRFPVVPIGKISLARFPAYKKKVIFLNFNFGLLLDGHHETLLVVETIPPQVPGLAASPWHRMDQSKRTTCATNVVPRHGHNLYRRQLVLIQDVHYNRVEREPKAIGKGRLVNRYAFRGWLIYTFATGIMNLYPVGRRYFSSSIDLFRKATTLGSGKWVLWPVPGVRTLGSPWEDHPLSHNFTGQLFPSTAHLLEYDPSLATWKCVQPPGHQLGPGGLETEGGRPPSRGQPTSQGRSHLTSRMKTYLYKYNTRCNPFRKAREVYLRKTKYVEGGVESRV